MPEDTIEGVFLSFNQIDELEFLPPSWGSWKDFFNRIIHEPIADTGIALEYLKGETKVWIQVCV